MASAKQRQFTELAAYLAENEESARAFALRAGLDKSTVSRLLVGKLRYVDPAVVHRIAEATEGKVGHVEILAHVARLAASAEPRKRAARVA